jgi:hypothetical protein
MAIVLVVAIAVLLITALILGVRAVRHRQQVDFYDPAAGSALRDSQASTSTNGFVGRGGGVGSGGK